MRVEHLYLAGPHRLVTAFLVDWDRLHPFGLATLKVANRVQQGGESGVIHAGERSHAACQSHRRHAASRFQIRTVPRFVTTHENRGNSRRSRRGSSSFKGVHCNKKAPPHRRWQAQILGHPRYPSRYIGAFPTEVEAAHAYDEAAREVFGECACVNFPRENERSALSIVTAEIAVP